MNHPTKQCNLEGVHAAHGWLDTELDNVYSHCGGADMELALKSGWLRIDLLAPGMLAEIRDMKADAIAEVLHAAVASDMRIGERFLVIRDEISAGGEVVDIVLTVEADPEGYAALANVHDMTPTGAHVVMVSAPSDEAEDDLMTVLYGEPGDLSKKHRAQYAKMATHDAEAKIGLPVDLQRTRAVRTMTERVDAVLRENRESETDPVPVDSDLFRIINEYLPEIESHLRIAGAHYGYDRHHDLGLRGQYADMYRKWAVLKRVMWDGEETTREPLRTILMDLIGHSLLTIALIDSEEKH